MAMRGYPNAVTGGTMIPMSRTLPVSLAALVLACCAVAQQAPASGPNTITDVPLDAVAAARGQGRSR